MQNKTYVVVGVGHRSRLYTDAIVNEYSKTSKFPRA